MEYLLLNDFQKHERTVTIKIYKSSLKQTLKMKTSVHLMVSAILAAVLYPVFQWKVIIIFVGGILIDIDHY